eukprot:141416_1
MMSTFSLLNRTTRIALISFKKIRLGYVRISSQNPYFTSSLTGGCILTFSDYVAQSMSAIYSDGYSYDGRRTLALGSFGFFYYGFVSRTIFWLYDVCLGAGAQRVLAKTLIECIGHTYTLFIPSYYFITGIIKGNTILQIKQQLRHEYFASSSATMCYWMPLMWFNFTYCRLQTQILFLSTFSFIHKTALSWYSNRNRFKQRLAQQAKQK